MSTTPSSSVSVVTDLLSSTSVVGFSGSRTPSASSRRAVRWALGQFDMSARVIVGCARDVEATVRAALPATRVRVFRASSFGDGPGAFSARSIACVQAVTRVVLFTAVPEA